MLGCDSHCAHGKQMILSHLWTQYWRTLAYLEGRGNCILKFISVILIVKSHLLLAYLFLALFPITRKRIAQRAFDNHRYPPRIQSHFNCIYFMGTFYSWKTKLVFFISGDVKFILELNLFRSWKKISQFQEDRLWKTKVEMIYGLSRTHTTLGHITACM